ncbi:hypothetical protein LAZ67_5000499 [Cordylochernes scorpioides]|uniref:Integrase catalytic domain-containing protein n=1 Tax=Cordylochernes scorpioides TaxID=51811 RepID=A0ABY6KHY9_9ARAC|nr:hypothetical protein LAZ67_5000499 [Cordylochernes scorpioides]
MAYNESFFTELNREQTQNVVVANGNKLQVKGIGQGEIKVITPQGKTDTLLLTKVLYIPELTDNLLSCIQGKFTKTPFPKKTEYRATETLQLVHSDVCDPLPTNSLSGKRYFITFTDDYSRYTKVYLLKGKDEVYEKIKDYVISAHTEFGKNIQTIRTDNGREYVNRQVEDFLNQSGIKHQLTVPYSPAQNGVTERKNRSLMEMTRCMLFDSGLPQSLWAEAVTTANYLHNRIPSKATDKTPFELWTNRKPSLKHLKRVGCKAFAYIPKIKRNKLDSKVIEGIFLGYDDRSKGYRILHDTDNITISRSVKFLEKENGFHHASTKTTSPQVLSTDLTSSYHIGNAEESQEPGTQSENLEDSETEDYIQPSTSTGTQMVTQRRSTRPTKGIPPIRNDYMLYKTEAQDIQTPTSYSEVLQLPKIEREKWLQAMNEELNSLEKNNVWELTPLPKDKKIIGCKWTYKQKLNSKGEIERYKARLVAKGFNQKFGRDYEETFAPIVKHSTIRAFLAASVYKGMQVNHLDVKTAFLHGDLDKELYMELPEGLHTKQTKTKHIATKIHHLKDLQKKTEIKMIYCPTGDMKADILTKPLPRATFEKLRYNLAIVAAIDRVVCIDRWMYHTADNRVALGCNMSLKIHFLHSHLDFFPDNLGAVSDEHGERFHQAISSMEKRYQGFTPAKLVFGHELRLPQPFQEAGQSPVSEDLIAQTAAFYERELTEEVEKIREVVRQTYLNEQEEARIKFENKRLRTFNNGDLVLVERMHETKGRHKFEPRYGGPYEVYKGEKAHTV